MAVLPEKLRGIDYTKPEEAIRTLENYIRYMHERIEFAHQFSGEGGADTSELEAELAVVKSELATVKGRLNNLNYGELPDKPSLEGVTLVGNKRLNEDGIHEVLSNLEIEAIINNVP